MGLAINRRTVLGIVNNPSTFNCNLWLHTFHKLFLAVTGDIYTAIKGKGAFRNGEGPLKTSGATKLSQAMILLELPAGASENKRSVALKNVDFLMKNAHSLRCPGLYFSKNIENYQNIINVLFDTVGPAALDISWVGAGSADGFVHNTLHCWDMSAG